MLRDASTRIGTIALFSWSGGITRTGRRRHATRSNSVNARSATSASPTSARTAARLRRRIAPHATATRAAASSTSAHQGSLWRTACQPAAGSGGRQSSQSPRQRSEIRNVLCLTSRPTSLPRPSASCGSLARPSTRARGNTDPPGRRYCSGTPCAAPAFKRSLVCWFRSLAAVLFSARSSAAASCTFNSSHCAKSCFQASVPGAERPGLNSSPVGVSYSSSRRMLVDQVAGPIPRRVVAVTGRLPLALAVLPVLRTAPT